MALVVALWILLVSGSFSPTYSYGSTKHLKEIVLGRCWDFQRQKKLEISAKNCSKIWETFHAAFAYKDPCKTDFSDYVPYFDEVGMEIVKPNKSLFWSGTYKEAHLFSDFDARLTTLEDTMAGWIMNNLTWCGSQSNLSDGINYNSCPNQTKSCDYVTPFWGQASKRFAEKASGIVRVMVNGTRLITGRPAYSQKSFFGHFELPNFNAEKIIELLILVVHNIDGPDLEVCCNGSIKQLEDDAHKRGIKTTCYDDPDDVRHLLCADYPNSRECEFFSGEERKVAKSVSCGSWKLAAIVTIVGAVLLFTIIGVIYVINRKKKLTNSFQYSHHTTE